MTSQGRASTSCVRLQRSGRPRRMTLGRVSARIPADHGVPRGRDRPRSCAHRGGGCCRGVDQGCQGTAVRNTYSIHDVVLAAHPNDNAVNLSFLDSQADMACKWSSCNDAVDMIVGCWRKAICHWCLLVRCRQGSQFQGSYQASKTPLMEFDWIYASGVAGFRVRSSSAVNSGSRVMRLRYRCVSSGSRISRVSVWSFRM